jgi:allantoin racemase
MRILWIDPIGAQVLDPQTYEILLQSKQPNTQLDLVTLPEGRPSHLEYHAYEALVISDIVQITYHEAPKYDALVIGCFYDVGLREAREVSSKAPVSAPCQAATAIASHLGNTFSVLVGRRKWIPKMKENVHLYGHGTRLASMVPLELGVRDFQLDHDLTCNRMLEAGRKAIEQDGAEVLILGCTAEYGFNQRMQAELGVPVIDALTAPLKYAEMLAETAQRFGWYPSRKWGSESPNPDEIRDWPLFSTDPPIGIRLSQEKIRS